MNRGSDGDRGLILIVDDDEGTVMALEMALSDEGYRVCSANNGKHALDVLDGCSPHVILLDIRMPIMDGPTFLVAYRNRPPPHAAVIAMTTTQTVQHPIPDDVEDVLMKPFDLEDLFAKIEKHLGRASRQAV
jgi:CheY-like chemotaxis protein